MSIQSYPLKITAIGIMMLLASCSQKYVIPMEKFFPKTIDPEFHSQSEIMESEKQMKRKIIGGNYFFDKKKGFKLCLEDRNQNGLFSDFGIDAVGITEIGDSTVLLETNLSEDFFGTGNLLQKSMLFEYNGRFFEFSAKGKKNRIKVKPVRKTIIQKPSFRNWGTMPNLPISFLFEKKIANLHEIIGNKSNTLIVFWASWCAPCIEELPILNQLAEYDVQIIHFCADDDLADARKIITENKVKGTHLIADSSSKRFFHQNGFPYILLYGKDFKLIDRIFPIQEAVNQIVKE